MSLYQICLHLLFPNRCLLCHDIIAENSHLCGKCWLTLTFINQICCHHCGLPMDALAIPGEHLICGQCFDKRPVFNRARAALIYDENSRTLISRFKYYDKTLYQHAFANWMIKAGTPLFQADSLLTPIPLHPKRLLKRRYNQSALLTSNIAKQTQLSHIRDLLVRTKHTPPQASLNRKQRLVNNKNAFRFNPKYASLPRRTPIILIDDVMTTGTTASACATALVKAGFTQIDLLTLARAPLS